MNPRDRKYNVGDRVTCLPDGIEGIVVKVAPVVLGVRRYDLYHVLAVNGRLYEANCQTMLPA